MWICLKAPMCSPKLKISDKTGNKEEWRLFHENVLIPVYRNVIVMHVITQPSCSV